MASGDLFGRSCLFGQGLKKIGDVESWQKNIEK